jgi:hypothetical protein
VTAGTIGQQAARQASWERHVSQALAIAMHPSQPDPGRLAVIQGESDDMTAPGPSHPASKAMRLKERQ